jgi:hypothetical protein
MPKAFVSRVDLHQAENEANRAEALRVGLVLVPMTAKKFVVVNVGPSRLDANYDPIPGGGVSQTNAAGRSWNYLRGSVVCGPAAYDECLVFMKDWLVARGAVSLQQ